VGHPGLFVGAADLSQLPLATESIWVRTIIAVTASYVVGHILAALGYSLYDGLDQASHLVAHPRLPRPATNTETNTIYYRYLYPSMFIEADRRETLTILRVALAVALLVGVYFLHSPLGQSVALVAGLFMLWNGYRSRATAASYRSSTIDAARLAKANNVPIFHWGDDDKPADGEAHDQDTAPHHAAGKADATASLPGGA
jgi:hypothetical protein